MARRYRSARPACDGEMGKLPLGLTLQVLEHDSEQREALWRRLSEVLSTWPNDPAPDTINPLVARWDEQLGVWIEWYGRAQAFWAGESLQDADLGCLDTAQRDLLQLGAKLWVAASANLAEEAVDLRGRLSAQAERSAACPTSTDGQRVHRRLLDGLAAHYDRVIDALVQGEATRLRALQEAEQRLVGRIERCRGEYARSKPTADCRES